MYTRTLLISFTLTLLIIASAILILFPEIDLWTARLFYEPDNGFIYKDILWVKMLHRGIPMFNTMYVVACLLGLIYGLVAKKPGFKIKSLYLLICITLSPGLMVNKVFKDQFGRARPHQIQEFGGSKEFSRAFAIAHQCDKNCSFVSGHAASGFNLSSFAFPPITSFNPYILSASIVAGSFVGLGRMMQGGHFLSDVFFAGIIVILSNYLISRIFRKLVFHVEVTSSKSISCY